MTDLRQEFEECYFRRQPQTSKEIEQAINAICISELCALRYGGKDLTILTKLHERGMSKQCDHPLSLWKRFILWMRQKK